MARQRSRQPGAAAPWGSLVSQGFRAQRLAFFKDQVEPGRIIADLPPYLVVPFEALPST